ncbi:MAG: alanine racemase [Burkholderiales bacterium]
MNPTEAIRPTHVEVSLGTIAQNFDAIRAHVGTAEIMPVVKANAYGHGIIEVSQHLAAHGARHGDDGSAPIAARLPHGCIEGKTRVPLKLRAGRRGMGW